MVGFNTHSTTGIVKVCNMCDVGQLVSSEIGIQHHIRYTIYVLHLSEGGYYNIWEVAAQLYSAVYMTIIVSYNTQSTTGIVKVCNMCDVGQLVSSEIGIQHHIRYTITIWHLSEEVYCNIWEAAESLYTVVCITIMVRYNTQSTTGIVKVCHTCDVGQLFFSTPCVQHNIRYIVSGLQLTSTVNI